jgi:glyoxylase-like metal-dependent hydrolase (beta-lactamase superfamily II)
MLKVYAMALGAYQTNCYIIHEESSKTCCVIDPGYDADRILGKLDALGLTLEAVLLTHGHFDHVGAVKDLAAETQCDVYLHSEDLTMPPMMTAGALYYTKTYAEGSLLKLAGLEISVLHTPGHTPGSVCLLADNSIFSGDTLFQGSCGRTDLPGGNWATITQSLKRLAALEGNFWVFPGHGGSTTLRDEKKYNPYMR